MDKGGQHTLAALIVSPPAVVAYFRIWEKGCDVRRVAGEYYP